jgi:serine protease Do
LITLSSFITTRLVIVLSLLAPAPLLAQATQPGRPPSLTERSRNSGTLKNLWMDVIADAADATVRVRIDRKDVALGTIVSADGQILTKYSEIHAAPTVQLADGRELPASLLGADEKTDLAMLKIDATDLPTARFADADAIEVGDFVASVGRAAAPISLGAVSVPRRKIPGRGGLLGVRLEDGDGGALIRAVEPNSGADRAGLLAGDVVTEISETPVDSAAPAVAMLRERSPGDIVLVTIRRGDDTLVLEATLGERPLEVSRRAQFQNTLGGALSRRANDFPVVIQHDTVLRPNDCGGPLVTIEGKLVGINIARAGRVESYAIPSDVILPLIVELRDGKHPAGFAPLPPPETPDPTTQPSPRRRGR